MLRTAAFYLSLSLLLAFNAAARDQDLTVNLKFVPQEGVHSESPDIPPSMLDRGFQLRVEDGRSTADAATIGQGTNDDDKAFSIKSGTDVVAYVKETLQSVAEGWGLKTSEPQRILTLRIARFFVEEGNKALGSVYASEVKFSWILTDAGEKKLAEGAGSGTAHRYGRARSADNCSEVLSDAMKEAFNEVLSSQGLQSAWISGKATAGASTAASSSSAEEKPSVEERLRKLDDLLKKGLITKEEYNTKRAEILKDV
jgi:hypothetical protein